MASEKATAIVLRVVEFSETSSVVTLFTREFGKIRGLAKGARRPKGPFESALDLLSICRVVFLRKSSDALDLLTEAKLEHRFRPAGGELSNLYAAYYVAELLSELTDDYDVHEDLFLAAEQALAALGTSRDVASVVLRFELTALRVLGHLPSFDTCVECGAAVVSEKRVPFGQLAGGVLCQSCRVGQKQVIQISAPVLAALKRFSAAATSEVDEPLDRRVYGELRAVLNRYIAHLIGHEPRLHRFLGA